MDIRTILMDHGIEDASKVSVEGDFSELLERINDLDSYISGSFRDGVINEIELKKIQIYLKMLADTNKRVLERYAEIEASESLEPGAVKDEFIAAKNAYDTAYFDLTSAITYAISDAIATPQESEQIDEAYLVLTDAAGRLEKAMQRAVQDIINIRASAAEANAIEYANNLKEELTEVTDGIQRKLFETEGYIDGAFRDGIITEYEAINIGSYLNTLTLQKVELDQRYKEIYNNYFLDGVPKQNLVDAKARYDAKYVELINIIRGASGDDKATPEEVEAVRVGFVELGTELNLLVSCMEKAIDAFSQERANKAEQLAKEYADSAAGEAQEAAEAAAKQYAEAASAAALVEASAYADGRVTEEEQRAMDEAARNLEAAKKYAEDMAEAARLAAEKFAEDKIGDADQANTRYAEAQMYLQKVINLAYLDKVITPEEEAEIEEAERLLEEAKGSADTLTKEAILAAQSYSDTQAREARLAAEAFAEAEAEAKRLEANAYADGIVTAEEERAIADAREKLSEAKTHAEKEAAEARAAAELYAEAEAEAARLYSDEQLDEVKKDIVYKVEIISSNGITFKNGDISTVLEARVYHGAKDVTSEFDANRFRWTRKSSDAEGDRRWNDRHFGGKKTVEVTPEDVFVRATFSVDILEEE